MNFKISNIHNKYSVLFIVLSIFYILATIFIQYLLPIIITVYNCLILNNNKLNRNLYNKFLYIELLGILCLSIFNNINSTSFYFLYFVSVLTTNSVLYYYKDIDKTYKQIIIFKICIFFIVYLFCSISNFNFKLNKNLFLFTNNISDISIKIT